MRSAPFLAYTAGRLAILAAVGAILVLLGFRSWALALLAVVLAMPLSYVLLRRQRLTFAKDVERRMRARRELRARLRGDEPLE